MGADKKSFNVSFTVKDTETCTEWVEQRGVLAFDERDAINQVMSEINRRNDRKITYINSVN